MQVLRDKAALVKSLEEASDQKTLQEWLEVYREVRWRSPHTQILAAALPPVPRRGRAARTLCSPRLRRAAASPRLRACSRLFAPVRADAAFLIRQELGALRGAAAKCESEICLPGEVHLGLYCAWT